MSPQHVDATTRKFQDAVDRARKRFGPGWMLIGTEFRSALVAQEAMALINAQDDGIAPEAFALFATRIASMACGYTD